MPVLARTLEAAGLATVLVTMMPFWAEKIGVPRTLAVEFPFGHTLGEAHNVAQQMRVIEQSLEVLETAVAPGTIIHSAESWNQPQKEAYKAWQPASPSPVIAAMAPQLRQMMRKQRNKQSISKNLAAN